MKVERKNKLLLFVVTLLLSGCLKIKAQVLSEELFWRIDTLSSTIIKIQLPNGYKKKIFVYDEGIFIDYINSDNSLITLFKGALQKVPLLSEDLGYMPQNVDTFNHKITIKGIIDNKAWREDSFKGIRIYYDKVPIDKVDLYDRILDSFHVLRNIRFHNVLP